LNFCIPLSSKENNEIIRKIVDLADKEKISSLQLEAQRLKEQLATALATIDSILI